MRSFFIFLFFLLAIAGLSYWSWRSFPNTTKATANIFLASSSKDNSPKRVGIQVGHLNIANVPPQLSDIKWELGAQVGDTTEVSLNYEIANQTANVLRQKGYIVDILPATVPPN